MKKLAMILTLVCAFALTGCAEKTETEESPYIEWPCGDETVCIIPEEGAEKSDFDFMNFVMDGQMRVYTGDDYTTSFGIDVSAHQGVIDWRKVADSGVEYVYIRCGYRGYTQGGLNTDKYFYDNIEGAQAAGIKVGVYFYSQAISADEAREEAEYTLGLIDGYDIDLEVMYDWEVAYNEGSRTLDIVPDNLTEWTTAYTDTIENRGYKRGVYTNRKTAYDYLSIKTLQDKNLTLWIAQHDAWPDFYYKHQIWQYSTKGVIDGIDAQVDLDLIFYPTTR